MNPPSPSPLAPTASIVLPFPARHDPQLKELLRRCSPATYEAALRYRYSGDISALPVLVRGLVERFVEPELRPRLQAPANEELRLAEDLGLDSLTMMEMVLLAEDILQITVSADELRHFRSLGDIMRFTVGKAHGLSAEAWPA